MIVLLCFLSNSFNLDDNPEFFGIYHHVTNYLLVIRQNLLNIQKVGGDLALGRSAANPTAVTMSIIQVLNFTANDSTMLKVFEQNRFHLSLHFFFKLFSGLSRRQALLEKPERIVYVHLAPAIHEIKRLCCVFFFVDMSDSCHSCTMFSVTNTTVVRYKDLIKSAFDGNKSFFSCNPDTGLPSRESVYNSDSTTVL